MNRITAILWGIGASVSCLGNDSLGNDTSLIAQQASEVTSAAGAEKNSKLMFATAGVYAVLLQDKDIGDEIHKRFEQDLRREQSLAPKSKSEGKERSREDLKAQIEAALDKHDPLAALDGVGRLVTFYSIADLAPLNAVKLGNAVRDVAGFCPKCFGTKKATCPNPNCNKSGGVSITKPCIRCNNGQIPCPSCNGSLWVQCDNCGGTAQVPVTIYKKRGALKVPDTHNEPCPKCRQWYNERPGSVRCNICSNGVTRCPTCAGKGTITEKGKCPVCDIGKVPCPDCKGTGKRTP